MDYWADFYQKANSDSKYFIGRVRVKGVERIPEIGEKVQIQVYCATNNSGGEYKGRVFDLSTFCNVGTDEKMFALEQKVRREDVTVFIHATSITGKLPKRNNIKKS